MKRWGLVGALLMCLALVSLPACSQSGDKSGVNQQPDETNRSDQQVTVSGRGTMVASTHRNLAFNVDGKIHEIYVKEGDKVSSEDALAKLDTTALELAFIEAEADLVHAQAALAQAEYNLEKTEDPYTRDDIKTARAAVDAAEDYLEYAEEMLDQGGGIQGEEFWAAEVSRAWANLLAAKAQLETMLDAPDEGAVDAAEKALEAAEVEVNVAEQLVTEAQKQLGEATLTAPFGGEVANIHADRGDSVLTGTTIVHLIDPTSMQLVARVNELDVVKVKTGQKVMISVDAMPGTTLEGLVTFISLVPREPGIVLFESDDEEKDYEVKIDFDIPKNSPIRVGMNATAEIIIE